MEPDYKTKAQIAYQYILKKIHGGIVKPGERLIIENITKQLDMSRIPVREAFKKLESEGILEDIPNKSARIREISTEDIKDIYEIRKIVEPQAAIMALDHITTSDIKYLEDSVRKMEKSFKQKKIEDYIDLNKDYHFYIYKKSNNKWMPKYIESLWHIGRWVNLVTYFEESVQKDYMDSHRKILKALQKRDKGLLKSSFIEHIDHAQKYIVAYLSEKLIKNVEK